MVLAHRWDGCDDVILRVTAGSAIKRKHGLITHFLWVGILLLSVWTPRLMAVQDFAGEWVSPYPQGNTLNDVWGVSGTDVFAVGDVGTIIHYDGKAWQLMQSPTTADLAAVWGPPHDPFEVFAVGIDGVVIHYQRTHPQKAAKRSGPR